MARKIGGTVTRTVNKKLVAFNYLVINRTMKLHDITDTILLELTGGYDSIHIRRGRYRTLIIWR